MAPLRVITVLLALVGAALAAETKFHITGSGTTTISTIMQTLSFAFRDVNPTSSVIFTGTSSGSGLASVLAGVSDFTAVNAFPSVTNLAGLPKIYSLLHSADALLPVYNMPGINDQLTISPQVLYSIYMNRTIWWDDASLVALNPGINLPHERIRVVYRPDSAGTNLAWTLFLSTVNSSFPVPVSTQPAATTWPFVGNPVQQSPFVIPASGGIQYSAAKIAATPYAIGYLAQLPASQYNVQNFKMVNRAGKVVAPTAESVAAAIAYALTPGATMFPKVQSYLTTAPAVAVDSSPVGSLLECMNAPVEAAWPIPEYNILMVPATLHSDCFRALEVAQFIMWSIHSDIARSAISKLLASPLPMSVANPILDLLSQSTCGANGEKKAFDTIFPYEQSIYAVAVFFAVFCWFVGLLAVLKRHHPAIKRVGLLTLLVAAVSFGLNFFTVLLWIGYPTSEVCASRMWISALSFVVLYGAIVYVFQDRVFSRLNLQELISDTLGTDKDAAAEVSDVISTISAVSSGGSHVSSGSGGSGSGGSGSASPSMSAYGSALSAGSGSAAMSAGSGRSDKGIRNNPKLILTVRLVLVVLLGAINFLIPIIWQAVEPPQMQFRYCVGSFANTFRQAMLFYNILLVVILCIGALTQRDRANFTSWPVHIMLLAAALFIPTNLMYTSGKVLDIPDRSPLAIFLSPAVGIVVSNAISGLLVLLPPVVAAFVRSVHDEVEDLAIEAQVEQVKSRLKGQVSGVEMTEQSSTLAAASR